MTKQYIITDPCYVLPKTVWSECFNKTHAASSPFDNNMFMSLVEKALSEYTGNKAFVNTTGYGDWVNHLWFSVEMIGEFASDSGLVCVCEFTGPVKEAMKGIPNCGSVFEAEGDITVDFDTKLQDWTVIKITDSKNNKWSTDLDYPDSYYLE